MRSRAALVVSTLRGVMEVGESGDDHIIVRRVLWAIGMWFFFISCFFIRDLYYI